MKPTFQFTEINSRRDSFASSRKGLIAPKTDYAFQPRSSDFSGHCRGKRGPSFRGISREYFETEARNHFRSEALVFGVIAIVAAIPLIESIRALAQFVYGVL